MVERWVCWFCCIDFVLVVWFAVVFLIASLGLFDLLFGCFGFVVGLLEFCFGVDCRCFFWFTLVCDCLGCV